MNFYTDNLWTDRISDAGVSFSIIVSDIVIIGFGCSKCNLSIGILGFIFGIDF